MKYISVAVFVASLLLTSFTNAFAQTEFCDMVVTRFSISEARNPQLQPAVYHLSVIEVNGPTEEGERCSFIYEITHPDLVGTIGLSGSAKAEHCSQYNDKIDCRSSLGFGEVAFYEFYTYFQNQPVVMVYDWVNGLIDFWIQSQHPLFIPFISK